ncbi:hypothetical protein J6590_023263 [Homalodisca vitripennis]|nr:hypothetical protein J6590_023263 [Homalodisca vitripennis]
MIVSVCTLTRHEQLQTVMQQHRQSSACCPLDYTLLMAVYPTVRVTFVHSVVGILSAIFSCYISLPTRVRPARPAGPILVLRSWLSLVVHSEAQKLKPTDFSKSGRTVALYFSTRKCWDMSSRWDCDVMLLLLSTVLFLSMYKYVITTPHDKLHYLPVAMKYGVLYTRLVVVTTNYIATYTIATR